MILGEVRPVDAADRSDSPGCPPHTLNEGRIISARGPRVTAVGMNASCGDGVMQPNATNEDRRARFPILANK